MIAFTETVLICSSAVFFPPIALTVLLVILLATFGKSLGLRKIYVDTLLKVFEWGARQIKTNEKMHRKMSMMSSSTLDLDYESGASSDDEEEMAADTDSAPLTDVVNGDASISGLRRRHGSGTSLCSMSSVCSKRSRHGSGGSTCIIRRATQIHLSEDEDDINFPQQYVNSRGWAVIRDSVDFVKAGIEAIIEDEVTSRFEAEQLATWNMLTRTSIKFYQFVNWKLTLLWGFGWVLRYCFLLPLRVTLFVIGLVFLIVGTAVIGLIPNGDFKRRMNYKCMLIAHRILSRCVSAVINFHDDHNKAKNGGICVANHTSPIDVMMLSVDNVYALIGQSHSGLLGVIQRALSRASSHIWFERSEAKDRQKVTAMLKEHCSDPDKLPILIFPEGTCINNTSVMQFKKGSFEVGTTIYPIAMKYDSRFGDAFWNSSEQSWVEYLMRMMTSWAIICNVWYLPPMQRLPTEDAVEFANRVKKVIANKGGLVDLEWDGQLKRSKVPPKLVAKQQEKYAHRLSRYTSTSEHGVGAVGAQKVDDDDDDDDYVSFLSPGVSGYASLEELPEDAVVADEDEMAGERTPGRDRRLDFGDDDEVDVEPSEQTGDIPIKADCEADLGIDGTGIQFTPVVT